MEVGKLITNPLVLGAAGGVGGHYYGKKNKKVASYATVGGVVVGLAAGWLLQRLLYSPQAGQLPAAQQNAVPAPQQTGYSDAIPPAGRAPRPSPGAVEGSDDIDASEIPGGSIFGGGDLISDDELEEVLASAANSSDW